MLRFFIAAAILLAILAVLALSTGSGFIYAAFLLGALALFLLYWFLRRGLPRHRGSLLLPGLKAKVEVHWDERGIPHINARNLHDLYMAQGYVTAQEHLWSMDLDRRAASGRLAEVFGSKLVALDQHFRTLGLHRAAEASLALYSPETRSYLEAYAAGVNARIAEGQLSPEFALLFYRPEPWSPVDTLTIAKYAAYGMSGNWEGELFRARLVQAVGAEKAAELFWEAPDMEALQQLEELRLPELSGLLSIAARTLTGTVGGNTWAVAGSKSRTGSPLLGTSLHLPVRSPSLWYQTHLMGPGVDAIGVTFPGLPGILLGRNQAIAWGSANLAADVQDLYLEQVKPGAPDQFRLQDRWESAEKRREIIRVRGSRHPVIHEVLVTRHGPVIARNDELAIALRWSALEPSRDLEGVLAINRAETWPAFRAAAEAITTMPQTLVYASRDGNIGWKAVGQVPIRSCGDGEAPVPGWTGSHEWQGYIPFEEMPEGLNPEEGFIAFTGQDPAPEGYPYRLGTSWAPGYRAGRLTSWLRGSSALTVERVAEIQTDTVNLQVYSLLQPLLNAVQEGLHQGPHPEVMNPTEKAALLMISGWDCNEAPDSPGAALWHQWYTFLVEAIFRPQMGLELFDQFVACGMPIQMTDRLLRQVAEGGESQWLAREGEQGLGRIALRSFRRAVALLAAKQGKAPERWRWGVEHKVRFEHPLTMGVRLLRPLLNLGPHPVGGSGTTLNVQGYSQLHPFQVTVTGSWRHIADLSLLDQSQGVCAPGQSGHPMSPHYGDQVGAWLKGEYFPVQLRGESGVGVVLEPGSGSGAAAG